MVLGVALVDVILSNIYRVLSIGFPRVIARGDLKNFKALAHYSLTAPPPTLNKACYLGEWKNIQCVQTALCHSLVS